MTDAVFEPREWERISGYLDQALDLEPQAREIWLDELAARQPAAAEVVRSLLAQRDILDTRRFLAESPLVSGACAALYRSSMAGTQVGAYTLDRLLGSGGMGEVWLASRSDGCFEGQCAIKFLAQSVVHPQLAERFRHEGGVLARLGHPNIARLLDAGSTSDGRQFLVLEYVDGVRIDEYCDTNDLPVRARVRLFVDAVTAVAHAHSQLIIHRDLKPSNVLVTRAGTVKLLDFGIAKLLSTSHAPRDGTLTRAEETMMTPDYAAPEQILGEMPSTATDVYQLGMLLYVLMAKKHPLQRHGSCAERMKAALTGDLPRASDLATGDLRKQLCGDLDAILKMALNPDPSQRYPTAAALREELLRYLDREPVSARRGARFYGAGKFIARHRVAVMSSVLAVGALLGTLVFALGQARMAASERDHALALSSRNVAVTDFLGTLISEAAEAETPVSVADMLARSEKLALADTHSSPENRAAVLAMLAARYVVSEQDVTAVRLLENGLALLRNSHDDSLRTELTCLRALSMAGLGHTETAVRAIEQELAHLRDDPRVEAYCLLYRAFIAGDAREAEPALRYAKAGLARFHAASQVAAADEGLFLGAIGWGYHLHGQNREADEYFRQAIQKYTDLGREASASAITMRNNWAVTVEGAGAPRQALEIHDRTLSLMAGRHQGEPAPPTITGNRARVLEALGRYREARIAYEAELSRAEQQHDIFAQAHGLSGLASTALAMHDRSMAEQYQQHLTALLTLAIADDAQPRKWRALVQGRLDMNAGRFEAAREQFGRALSNPYTWVGMNARLGKSEAELRGGHAAAAAEDARLALNAARAMQGNLQWSSYTGLSWLALGRADLPMRKNAEAQRALRSAIDNLSNTLDDGHPSLLEARSLLSDCERRGMDR
jgi:serine/threonine-protein kinase